MSHNDRRFKKAEIDKVDELNANTSETTNFHGNEGNVALPANHVPSSSGKKHEDDRFGEAKIKQAGKINANETTETNHHGNRGNVAYVPTSGPGDQIRSASPVSAPSAPNRSSDQEGEQGSDEENMTKVNQLLTEGKDVLKELLQKRLKANGMTWTEYCSKYSSFLEKYPLYKAVKKSIAKLEAINIKFLVYVLTSENQPLAKDEGISENQGVKKLLDFYNETKEMEDAMDSEDFEKTWEGIGLVLIAVKPFKNVKEVEEFAQKIGMMKIGGVEKKKNDGRKENPSNGGDRRPIHNQQYLAPSTSIGNQISGTMHIARDANLNAK